MNTQFSQNLTGCAPNYMYLGLKNLKQIYAIVTQISQDNIVDVNTPFNFTKKLIIAKIGRISPPKNKSIEKLNFTWKCNSSTFFY